MRVITVTRSVLAETQEFVYRPVTRHFVSTHLNVSYTQVSQCVFILHDVTIVTCFGLEIYYYYRLWCRCSIFGCNIQSFLYRKKIIAKHAPAGPAPNASGLLSELWDDYSFTVSVSSLPLTWYPAAPMLWNYFLSFPW